MFKRFFVLLVFIISGVVLAQETPPSFFTLANEAPIVARGNERTDWDRQYTDPGAVFYHEGKFHMFRNGFVGWPASVQIGYLVSDDGINWIEPQDEPVLRSEEVPYAKTAALASSAIVLDDGTWALYFYTWNTGSGASGKGAIGRATADNPLGPWTVDADPVLLPGAEDAWDGESISAPQIVKTEDGYLLYFTGYDKERTQQIGVATSTDGIVWEKYAQNPILTVDAEWEGMHVHHARVVHTANQYVLVYRGSGNNQDSMGLGLAVSDDGFSWTKYANNPIFAPQQIPEQQAFWFTAATWHADTLYVYVEAMPVFNTTDIYVLTYSGELPPAD